VATKAKRNEDDPMAEAQVLLVQLADALQAEHDAHRKLVATARRSQVEGERQRRILRDLDSAAA
jgi:hypothetical protein